MRFGVSGGERQPAVCRLIGTTVWAGLKRLALRAVIYGPAQIGFFDDCRAAARAAAHPGVFGQQGDIASRAAKKILFRIAATLIAHLTGDVNQTGAQLCAFGCAEEL